jgi:hypothetical protein
MLHFVNNLCVLKEMAGGGAGRGRLQQLCHIGPFQKLIAVLDALMFNIQKAEYFPNTWLHAYHQHFERARQRRWLQLFTLPKAGLRRLIN